MSITDAQERPVAGRRTRSALWRTTSLSGALALVLLAPAVAAAEQDCGKPSHGVVTCSADGDYSDGVSYAFDPPKPQDLTIVIEDGAQIDSGASTGLFASNTGGDITVSGSGASVSTTGDGAFGVFVQSYDKAVHVDMGSIETSGDHAAGLVAYSAYGVAEVKAHDVTTSGDFSAGVFVGGGSGSQLDVDSVRTTGESSTGVFVVAGSYTTTGDATANVGTVETTGYGSYGVVVESGGGRATLNAHQITTSGDYAVGAFVGTQFGSAAATVDSVSTHGAWSHGVYAVGYGGPAEITVGTVTTEGDLARGVRSWTLAGDNHVTLTGEIHTSGDIAGGIFTTSLYGDTVVDNQGKIVTTGAGSDGIISVVLEGRATVNAGTIETSGDGSVGVHVLAVGGLSAINLTADSVTTSGAHADGVFAENPTDVLIGLSLDRGAMTFPSQGYEPAATADADQDQTIRVTTDTVKVTGEGSVGVRAISAGDVFVDAGDTSSASAQALVVRGRGQASVTIHGAASSAQSDALDLQGADAKLTVDQDASVEGRVNGVVLRGMGAFIPGPQLGDPGSYAGGGLVTVDNQGTISAESGYAILVQDGQAAIHNAGTIRGAVSLGTGDDVVDNTGTFEATKDSDFGEGTDRFINTGTVAVLTHSDVSGTVRFLGLERFENSGGLVDLRNTHTDDVLSLSGDYVGSGDARLALNVSATGSDRLVVAGAATGKTSILLDPIDPNAIVLQAAGQPITLVDAGAGTAADAFVIANPEIGFTRYGLKFDAAAFDFNLASQAGLAAYRAMKLNAGANGVWRQSAEAWSSHLAADRDIEPAQQRARVWGQFFGAAEQQDDERQLTGPAGEALTYVLDYTQTYYGFQTGAELAAGEFDGGSASWGVTGGYDRSLLHFPGADQSARFDSVSLGAYAAVARGSGFFNLLAQYGHHWIDARDGAAGYAKSLDGNSYGLQAEAGVRLGSEGVSFEPLASMAYVRSNLADLTALGQTLDFDKADGLRGRIGARLSSSVSSGSSELRFFAAAAAVHEFKGKAGLTLASEHLQDRAVGTYGQASVGLDLVSARGLTGYVQADGALGDGYKSAGGRIGLRVQF